jgi:hypothetical protein
MNMDESCWCIHPGGRQTWPPTGSQNIQAFCNGGEKDSFIVVAAITAGRAKLPLTLIATRKIHTVEENHFGDIAITELTIQSPAGQPLTLFSGGSPGCEMCTMMVIRFG